MSLRAALGKAVDSAFAAVGDIPEAVTLTVRTGGTYSAATGASHTTAVYNLDKVVCVKPTAEDVSATQGGANQQRAGIKGEYMSFLLNVGELTRKGFTGKIEVDDVLTYQGNPYRVVEPADIFGLVVKVLAFRGTDGT